MTAFLALLALLIVIVLLCAATLVREARLRRNDPYRRYLDGKDPLDPRN